MSVVPYVIIPINDQEWHNDVAAYSWAGLAVGDTGQPVQGPGYADESIQVEGTPGAGFSINIEGSNDGVNYHPLHDPFGNVLTFTTVGVLAQVLEITFWIRPNVTAGDGTTSVTVTMVKCNHLQN